jgi:hypothetical protein
MVQDERTKKRTEAGTMRWFRLVKRMVEHRIAKRFLEMKLSRGRHR